MRTRIYQSAFALLLFTMGFSQNARAEAGSSNPISIGGGFSYSPYGGRDYLPYGSFDKDIIWGIDTEFSYRFHRFFAVASGLEFKFYSASNSTGGATNLASYSAKVLRIPVTINYVSDSFLKSSIGMGLAFATPVSASLRGSTGTNLTSVDNNGLAFDRTRSIVEFVATGSIGIEVAEGTFVKLFLNYAPFVLSGSPRVLMSLNGNAYYEVKSSTAYLKGYSSFDAGLRFELNL